MKDIAVIAHNIRSAHNIGALLRLCDGVAVSKIYCTGYTPYPKVPKDDRLPHVANKVHARIAKTALGSENTVNIETSKDIDLLLKQLKNSDYRVLGLEQASGSKNLPTFQSKSKKIALLLGEEVKGIDPSLIKKCDEILEIPMLGKKESHNVVQAAAMALYQLRFIDT